MARRVKVVERVVRVPDFKSEEYDQISRAVETECRQHRPSIGESWGPGWGGPIRFWCSKCHTPWPCWFLRWVSSFHGSSHWTADPLTYDPEAAPAERKARPSDPPDGSEGISGPREVSG